MVIDYNIDHKNFGHYNRDKIRKIAKDKGYTLAGSWKSCLGCTADKGKKMNLSSDSNHKVDEKPSERVFGDATIIKNLKN